MPITIIKKSSPTALAQLSGPGEGPVAAPKTPKSQKGLTTPKLKQQLAKITAKGKAEPHLGPGIEALCQCLAGGNMAAGRLLFTIRHLWITRKKKFQRAGKDWLVFSRDEWALAAGLTEAQLKNNALPRLRKYVNDCVGVKAMKTRNDGPKKLGIRLDVELLDEQLKGLAGESWDILKVIVKHGAKS
jgi:hypothetical protein